MGRIERGRRAKRRQVGPGAGRRCSPGCPSAVALAVRLQDVDVVGEPVQQRAGQALRAEDLDERFRSGGGQGHEAQFVDDQQVQTEQIPPEVEPPSLVLGPQRFALPCFHRRDAPARLPSRCTSPRWRCWTAGLAAWLRSPAGMAGNSPVYGPGWKLPLVVAQGVAGKPSLFLPGRTVYFCHSSQG